MSTYRRIPTIVLVIAILVGFPGILLSMTTIHVDPIHGDDTFLGDALHPLKSISGALDRLDNPLDKSVTIRLTPGTYTSTGGKNMPQNSLHLFHHMRPNLKVTITGISNDAGEPPILAWEGAHMIIAREGEWRLENIQIGMGSKRQRRGVMVLGPALVTLKNISFKTRSLSDAAIYAQRGGKVLLQGSILINEDLHDEAEEETFAGIIAEDHGLVKFDQKKDALLSMGNGSLSASYYGVIRLGCETARITSWGDQSNTLAVNNSGRIDLHGTETHICAKKMKNTPIGLEHDGHILGEGAHIIIEGENDNAIVLQKASTLTCNDIELKGHFSNSIVAMSGSMFVGRFISDVTGIRSSTGASINIDKVTGLIHGPVTANTTGTISLPDENIVSR
jgi:hypothetical protein